MPQTMSASTTDRLRERNFEAVIVDTAADAKAAVLERIPTGAEVHSGKSKALENIGVFKELMDSDRYHFVRPSARAGGHRRTAGPL
jgi:hypothetical protein